MHAERTSRDPPSEPGGKVDGHIPEQEGRPDNRRIRDASVRGAGAGVLALLAQAVLRVASIAVLARLLTPEDFGVAAMAGILLTLFQLVGDWGLTTASTQRRSVDHYQISNLFWINTVIGLTLAGIAALLSPVMALIFDEPRLTGAAIVLALTLVAIGLGAQHEALMNRRLRYTSLQMISVGSAAIGIAVGVTAALAGAGFWSLICMHVTTQGARTVLYWIVLDWRPSRARPEIDVRPVLSFATGLVPSRLLYYLSRRFGTILLGAVGGATDVGLFHQAQNVAMMPASYLVQPLQRVVPASLSRLQDDTSAFERMFVHTLTMITVCGCGMLGFMAAEAPALVGLVLGPQWMSTIPIARWLTLAGMAFLVAVATGWVFVSLGAGGVLFRVRAIRLAASIAGVVIGWRWGAVGVAAGYSIAVSVSLLVELVYAVRRTPLSLSILAQAIWRPLLCALVSGGTVLMIRTGTMLGVLLEAGLYSALYVGLFTLLPGGRNHIRSVWRAISAVRLSHNAA